MAFAWQLTRNAFIGVALMLAFLIHTYPGVGEDTVLLFTVCIGVGITVLETVTHRRTLALLVGGIGMGALYAVYLQGMWVIVRHVGFSPGDTLLLLAAGVAIQGGATAFLWAAWQTRRTP